MKSSHDPAAGPCGPRECGPRMRNPHIFKRSQMSGSLCELPVRTKSKISRGLMEPTGHEFVDSGLKNLNPLQGSNFDYRAQPGSLALGIYFYHLDPGPGNQAPAGSGEGKVSC